MKHLLVCASLALVSPGLLAQATLTLSGGDEVLNHRYTIQKKEIDQKLVHFEGACYNGNYSVSYGGVTIREDIYAPCEQSMSIPTCRVPGLPLKKKVIGYTGVCDTGRSSDIIVPGGTISKRIYTECKKEWTVSYCERPVTVDTEIVLNITNSTHGSGQSLVLENDVPRAFAPRAHHYVAAKTSTVVLHRDSAQEKVRVTHDLFVIPVAEAQNIFAVTDLKITGTELSIGTIGSESSCPIFGVDVKLLEKKKLSRSMNVVFEKQVGQNFVELKGHLSNERFYEVSAQVGLKKGVKKIAGSLDLEDRSQNQKKLSFQYLK